VSFIAGERPVTLERYDPGSYNNGYFDPGAKTEETIYLSVDSVDPEEIERLPEGESDHEMVKLESRFRLYTSEAEKGEISDFVKVEVDGDEKRFKILRVEPSYSRRTKKFHAYAVLE